MGGSNTKKTTSGAGAVTPTNFTPEGFGKELGSGAQNAFRDGSSQVFDKDLYAGMSPETKAALASMTSTAKGSVGMMDGAQSFAQGLIKNGNTSSLTETNMLDVANGKYLDGANPYFEANLAKSKDSTYADVMASLGGTGRTGSSVHMDELTGALGNLDNSARGQQYETERDRQIQALSSIEGTRQQGVSNAMGAAASLPGIYSAAQLPNQTLLQAGQMRDTDAQAQLMADYDLFTRKDPYSNLSKYASLFNSMQGTQGVAPTAPEPHGGKPQPGPRSALAAHLCRRPRWQDF